MKINSVSIKIKPNNTESIQYVKKLISILDNKGIRTLLPDYDILKDKELSPYISNLEDYINLPDIVIVIGGDGTLLGAARLYAGTNIPIFGINKGRLGFLTEFMPDEALNYLTQIIDGNYEISERSMLEAIHIRENEIINSSCFLNDAVISRDSLSRLVKITLEIDNQFLSAYTGDGLIVSSPTGSTAYSLSAGGPIILPNIESVYIINPICPHTLTIRPMVVSSKMVCRARIESGLKNLLLTIDGQEAIQLQEKDEILFTGSDKKAFLITHPKRKYYAILRQKLGWNTHFTD